MSSFPDYYKILNIQSSATADEVRQAYKRESLKTHPDRLVNATSVEKKRATERFQAVADAYYVLSDSTRRREYDTLYKTRTNTDRTDDSASSQGFFGTSGTQQARPDAEGVFSNVFEEMLRPEVERAVPVWSWVGGLGGGALGFIVANLPGMMVGGLAGNRLGAIRDAKGKSVAAVFSQLGGDQKAEILRALAMKVLGSATS